MKTVIEMAREAGAVERYFGNQLHGIAFHKKEWLERFAALVREDAINKFNRQMNQACEEARLLEQQDIDCPCGSQCIKCSAAVLVEREACAKVCDELFDTIEHDWDMMEGAGQCAAAIRARGK